MTTLISVTLALRCCGYPRALPESLIYRSAWGYGLAMRVLYGRYYAARDAAVAAHISDGASVLELCCGPARLYLRELRGRIGSYVALDVSERFVDRLRALGVDARRADVATAELPVADIVVMQASLYQFEPDAEAIVRRMRGGRARIGDRRRAGAQPRLEPARHRRPARRARRGDAARRPGRSASTPPRCRR